MACRMKKPRKYDTGGVTGIIGMLQGAGNDVREDIEKTDEFGNFENKESVTWGAAAGSFLDPTMMFTDEDWSLGQSGRQYTINKENRLRNEASMQRQTRREATYTGTGSNPYTPLLPYGGQVDSEIVELERGEPFMLPDGRIESVPDDAPTHAKGGVKLNLPHGTKVLGKKNAGAGDTYKKLGKKLERLQKKHQNKINNKESKLSINTSQRMLDNVQKEFNNLFVEQGEDITPQDQMMYGGTAEYAYGGKIRKAYGGIQSGFGRDPYQFGSPAEYQIKMPSDYNVPYSIMNDLPIGNNYNQATPVAQQPLEQPRQDKTQQWTNGIMSAAPIMYNLYQASKKAEKVNASDYYNPYEAQIMSTMANRRYNVSPELEQARLGQATYNRKLREAGVTQQQYLGGLQSSSITTNRLKANALAKKQEIDNRYKSEEAQMQAQLGANKASANRYAAEVNSQNQAARRNFLSTASTQSGQLSQTQRLMDNQRLRDEQLLALLPSMYSNYKYDPTLGYTHKEFQNGY